MRLLQANLDEQVMPDPYLIWLPMVAVIADLHEDHAIDDFSDYDEEPLKRIFYEIMYESPIVVRWYSCHAKFKVVKEHLKFAMARRLDLPAIPCFLEASSATPYSHVREERYSYRPKAS